MDSAKSRPGRAWAVAYPGLAALVAFVSVFTRQTGIPKASTMWAEDGYVFLGCHTRGESVLYCLGEAYGGYLHVVPRIAAMVAWLAPPDLWSIAVTTAAAAVLGVAAFSTAAAIGQAPKSSLAGLVGGAALGLTYEAGHEVAGNLANLHWILLVGATVVVVAAWLGRTPGRLDFAVVVGAAFSSPLMAIVVSLALAGWIAKRAGCRSVFAVAFIGSVIQLVVAGPFGLADPLPGVAVPAMAGIAALGLMASNSRERRGAVLAVGGLIGAGLAAYLAAVLINRWEGPRYEYVPAVMLIEAAVVGAALLGSPRRLSADADLSPGRARRLLRRLPLAVVAGAVMLGAGSSYRLESRTSRGPDFGAEFRAAVAACREGVASALVPISPRLPDRTWTVEVPCARVGRSR